MPRRIFMAGAILAGLCLPAAGQFFGGGGDGYDRKALYNFPLDRVYPPVNSFLGGNGDGYTHGTLFNLPLDGSNDPPTQTYLGGAGDGFARIATFNLPLDGSNNPPAQVYLGGTGDGFEHAAIFNLPLDGSNYPPAQAYLGGAGDGFEHAAIFNLPLDGSNNPPASAYLGDSGDGFDSGQTVNMPLSGAPPVNSFLGGSGDGFSSAARFNQSVSNAPSIILPFLGGSGDGFDHAAALSIQMLPADIVDPYRGGAGDGFSATGLFNVVIDPTPPPYALIGLSPNPSYCQQVITFTGAGSVSVSNNIVSYLWDFGDGNTSSGVAVTHGYSGIGTYTAKLTAVDDAVPAQYGYGSAFVFVNNRGPDSQPGGPYTVFVDQPFVLDGSLSADPDVGCGDAITNFNWGFGVAGPFSTTSTAPTFATSFASTGSYTARLRVFDSFGQSATSATSVQVLSPGYLAFDLPDYTVPENKPTLSILVIRTNGLAGAVSVEYVTSNGTAAAGSDFVGATGVLAFAAGQSQATLLLGILDDVLNEGDETFKVYLRSPQGWAKLGGQTNIVVHIQENDVPGVFNLSATNFAVDESDGQVIARVDRLVGASGSVSVQYDTLAGTATPGSDYTTTTGILNFADQEFSQPVVVPILQDSAVEGTESFTIRIKNPAGGAVLGTTTSAVVDIIDDDLTLSFSASTYPVSEGAGSAVVTVVRSGPLSTTTRVDYATSDGTAANGFDYIGVAGTLNFTSGQATATFFVPIINDATAGEPDESIQLTLSNPGPGTSLGTLRQAVVSIRDNEKFKLNESFDTGLPLGWVVKANANPKGIWRFDDPGRRSNATGGSGGFAIADSDFAGLVDTDTELISPVLNLEDVSLAQLSFRYSFVWWPSGGDEYADVDISVNGRSGPWVNAWSRHGGNDYGPQYALLDISAIAAGHSAVAIRFHYYRAHFDWWWQVDNVTVAAVLADPVSPGRVRMASSAYTVRENARRALVTAIRVGGNAGTVQATLQTQNGSAVGGSDFTPATATLIFPPGVESASTVVPILDDTINEDLESFRVVLSNPTGGAILDSPSTSTVTIVDDDGLVSDIGVGVATPSDPLVKGAPVSVMVSASNNGPQAASHVFVQYTLPPTAVLSTTSLSKGLATNISGIVSWNVGALNPYEDALMVLTCRFVTVGQVTNSARISGDEADYTAGNDSFSVTGLVRSAGRLQFSSPVFEIPENGGSVRIDVARSEDNLGPASVNFAAMSGTAQQDADFAPTNGTLSFADGQIIASFDVDVFNDALVEGQEYLYMHLSGATAADIGSADAAVAIADDDVLAVRANEGFGNGSGPLRRFGNSTSGWAVVNNVDTNGWRFDDPGSRSNRTGGASGFAVADSAAAGNVAMDTELRSPTYNMSDLQTVVVEFKTDLESTSALADLLASTNGAAGPWNYAWSSKGLSITGPQTISLDVSPLVAGRSSVCFSFHYYEATNDGWWQVDDFKIVGEEDSDGDGLPDWWESLNFQGLGQGATNDFDLDGISNLMEFQADTSPTNWTSLPEIRKFLVTNNTPAVAFAGSPHRLYDIQGATDLRTNGWSIIESSIPGSGGVQTNALDASVTNQYFRLLIRSY